MCCITVKLIIWDTALRNRLISSLRPQERNESTNESKRTDLPVPMKCDTQYPNEDLQTRLLLSSYAPDSSLISKIKLAVTVGKEQSRCKITIKVSY